MQIQIGLDLRENVAKQIGLKKYIKFKLFSLKNFSENILEFYLQKFY